MTTTQEAIENIARLAAEFRAAEEKADKLSSLGHAANIAAGEAREALERAQFALLEIIDTETSPLGFDSPLVVYHRRRLESRSTRTAA